MAETDPDLIDDLPPPPNLAAGYERRMGMISSQLRKRIEQVADLERQLLESGTTNQTQKQKIESMKASHATEIEESETKRTREVSRMERKQALTAAGVEPEGFDTVLAAYEAVGEDRPPIDEWLKGEELPKHVTTYMGGTEPERRGRPAPKRPDGGTGPVRIPGGRTRLSEMTSIEELKAAKERGDF